MSPEDMLGQALGEVARPLGDFMKKLAGEEGRRWLERFKLFVAKQPCNDDEVSTRCIVAKRCVVTATFSYALFIPSVRFPEEKTLKVSSQFREHLLGPDVTEQIMGERKIHVHDLVKSAKDSVIMSEFGLRAPVQLIDLLYMVKSQPPTQTGPLNNCGKGNLFFLRGKDKTPMVANVWRQNEEWYADARFADEDTSGRGLRVITGGPFI